MQENSRRNPLCKSIFDIETKRIMESVRSAFHAQLATVMDSLLAAAVCEIAKIFESSLCEQQAELAQKSQEISILQRKLEEVERRPKAEEISILRERLEKVDRRPKAKGGGGDEEEQSSGGREEQSAAEVNAGKGASSHPDPAEGASQSVGSLKEEVTGSDGASVKHERVGSRPTTGSLTVQPPEGSLTVGSQRQIDTLSVSQAKTKLSHWEQSRSSDHRPLHDHASAPFLSISQSGRCSPRPDTSLAQPGEWLPGLDATRGALTGLEGLQAEGTSCSGTAGSSAGTDAPCYRHGFGSDETSNEDDDGSFPFLDQEPENQDSNQAPVQEQGVLQRGARQVQTQPLSAESPWRPRDDRGGRGPINHTRRVASFGNRDPLRPQSNSQLLTLRHTNTLSLPAATGGGTGRPYTCPYCTKCFTYPSHQRRHLLRHTGVRLHPCQFCEKSFLTPSELTVHTRTHTGERPFGCAQCGKRFARSGNLRAHQRDVHMGKRPFACTECGKRFAHRGNLRVHNHRVHQGDPYYIDDQQEPDMGPNPI